MQASPKHGQLDNAVPSVEVKKPYEKPDIAFQSPLETMAAECPTTKADGTAPCSPSFS